MRNTWLFLLAWLAVVVPAVHAAQARHGTVLAEIAIDKGVLQGVDQPIAPLLQHDLPARPDPRLARITIGHLLSMQAGLARTSGPNHGRRVGSRNWVRYALARPFEDAPGGGMLYSTGSRHLLSAILTRVTGKSTLQLSRQWLGPQRALRSWPGRAIRTACMSVATRCR